MEHYFSEKQTSRLRIKEINESLRGNSFRFCTGSGVFSVGKVDKGTELLIEKCLIKEGWRILDMGCGYGAIGISVAKAFPSANILMADINQRAVKLSRRNIGLNKVGNAEAVQSDLYKRIEGKFDSIITNPPQKAGKSVCFEIIERAKDYLKKDGLLQIVARHNKGGKELERKMKEVFGNAEDIARKSGYRVYVSCN